MHGRKHVVVSRQLFPRNATVHTHVDRPVAKLRASAAHDCPWERAALGQGHDACKDHGLLALVLGDGQ
eukprot:6513259-Heterocapsa_arctica.AAC.1